MNPTPKLVAVLLTLSGLAAAQPAPSPDEIKKVVDYYMNGKDAGPILVDFKACVKVDTDKASPTVNECLEPATGKVKKGPVSAWMMWFVPRGSKYEDVTVQALHENQVRETKDVVLSDSMRSRSYKTVNLSKPGKWTFKVLRGDKELAKADVTVE